LSKTGWREKRSKNARVAQKTFWAEKRFRRPGGGYTGPLRAKGTNVVQSQPINN